jgi:hypothetical protein
MGISLPWLAIQDSSRTLIREEGTPIKGSATDSIILIVIFIITICFNEDDYNSYLQ